jgi:hypothetical protein
MWKILEGVWRVWMGTGRFDGVCPRCRKPVSVPRGKLCLRLPFGKYKTICPLCGNMGDNTLVELRRVSWI